MNALRNATSGSTIAAFELGLAVPMIDCFSYSESNSGMGLRSLSGFPPSSISIQLYFGFFAGGVGVSVSVSAMSSVSKCHPIEPLRPRWRVEVDLLHIARDGER